MNLAKYLLAIALIVTVAAALASTATTAAADRRVFIIANQPDGYGIDRCLANGDRCGAPAARAYCESHEFKTASDYRRVEPEEVTGAIPASGAAKCSGRACAADYVAITCER